jgi:hypothetical protein
MAWDSSRGLYDGFRGRNAHSKIRLVRPQKRFPTHAVEAAMSLATGIGRARPDAQGHGRGRWIGAWAVGCGEPVRRVRGEFFEDSTGAGA